MARMARTTCGACGTPKGVWRAVCTSAICGVRRKGRKLYRELYRHRYGVFSSKEEGGEGKTDQAKELLAKRWGVPEHLSLISLTLCYLLISASVDVQELLAKVGIVTGETGGKVGTFAMGYAAHKAASPIRFPPTVALTPVVASWIDKIRKGGD